jgi:hypothetical protein
MVKLGKMSRLQKYCRNTRSYAHYMNIERFIATRDVTNHYFYFGYIENEADMLFIRKKHYLN